MKKILYVLPIILFVAVGCSNSQPMDKPQSTNFIEKKSVTSDSAWKTYRNTKYGFEIDYPSALNIREESDTKFQPASFSTFFEGSVLNGYVLVNNPGVGTGFSIPVSTQQIKAGGKNLTMELLDSPTDQERASIINLTYDGNEFFILFRYHKNDPQQAEIAKNALSSFRFLVFSEALK